MVVSIRRAIAILFTVIVFIGSLSSWAQSATDNSCGAKFSDQPHSAFSLSLKIVENRKGIPQIQLFEGGHPIANLVNYIFRALNRPIGLDQIALVISRLERDERNLPFFVKVLDAAEIQVEANTQALSQVPRSEGLIIFSNHPLLGVDGLAIASVIQKVRPDTRVVLNRMFQGFPGLAKNAIFVDPFLTPSAKKYNISQIQIMNQHVENGGALLIFPSGSPAQKNNLNDLIPVDQTWRKGLLHLMKQGSNVTLLPVFTEGAPSPKYLHTKFYLNKLAQALVPSEIGRQVGSRVRLHLGTPLTATSLNSLSETEKLVYLRARTYLLGHSYIDQLKDSLNVEISTRDRKTFVSMNVVLSPEEAEILSRVHPTLDSLLGIFPEMNSETLRALDDLKQKKLNIEKIISHPDQNQITFVLKN